MTSPTFELAKARIDDLLRRAADRRRADESRERVRGARPASIGRRRLTRGLRAPRRVLRPSGQSPAAARQPCGS
jgi:hypothetical protein